MSSRPTEGRSKPKLAELVETADEHVALRKDRRTGETWVSRQRLSLLIPAAPLDRARMSVSRHLVSHLLDCKHGQRTLTLLRQT